MINAPTSVDTHMASGATSTAGLTHSAGKEFGL